MEDLLFGGEWLDDLLREKAGSPHLKKQVRKHMREIAESENGVWESDWRDVEALLRNGKVGDALEKAMSSLARVRNELEKAFGEGRLDLERSFSPFLIRGREIKRVLYPPEDMEELACSADDLDTVMGLEMINDIRRLLASWGAGGWREEPLELITRLDKDLEELRECQALLGEQEGEEQGLEFSDREIELADRIATLTTRFAGDLVDLHLLNARNPEVPMRFNLLWNTVRQLEEGRNEQAAALEGLQVLEEALSLAGLGGGELLQRIDLLYDRFSDAEQLRQAVDHLDTVIRDRDGSLRDEQARSYVETIASALAGLGLEIDLP